MQKTSLPELINSRYKIIDILGKGGMGIVYQVEDTLKDNMKFALKTIHKSALNMSQKAHIATIKKEYEIMTRLKHPNLVQVYDFGFEKDNCFIVMDYLKGILLKDFIQLDRPHSIYDCLDIIVQISRALEFIHSRNIIYRDLKPSNIILSDKRIILLDFGVADTEHAKEDKIKGTVLYLAPEVLKGDINYRLDIFALGIVFYELLTNDHYYLTPGFRNISDITNIMRDRSLFDQHMSRKFAYIENKSASGILRKMMAYDPYSRYKNSFEIIYDINKGFDTSFEIETVETRQSYILGCDFANRKEEISFLKKNLYSDNSKMLTYSGTVGVGKTRLFQEFKKFCRINDIPFYESSCTEGEIMEYYSIAELLKQIILSADKELINRYSPQLSLILPQMIEPVKSIVFENPKVLKEIIIEKISDFIIDFSRTKGRIILYYNDIQWIDEGSADILKTIISKNKYNSISIYSNINEDFIPEHNPISHLLKDDYSHSFTLQPLDISAINDYFEKVFGKKFVHKSIRNATDEIKDLVGGNPLFLEQLTKGLIERDLIIRDKGYWKLICDMRQIDIPSNIKDMLKMRIDKLLMDQKIKDILQILSLLRIELNLEIIKKIFQKLTISDIPSHLQLLERQEILITNTSGNNIQYNFNSSLVKKIIKKSILNTKELNLLIAVSLESLSEQYHNYFTEETAYHYHKAGKDDKAVHYYIRSADYSQSLYYNEKAINLYNEALNILKTADTEKYINILLKKSYSLESLSRWNEAIELLKVCIKVSQKNNYHILSGRSYNLYGMISLKQGNYQKAKEMFDSAYEIFKTNEKSKDYADTLYNIGTYYFDQSSFNKAIKYYMKYKDLCYELKDKKGYSISLNDIGNVFYYLAKFDEAISYYNEYRDYSQNIGDTRGYGISMGNIGNVYYIKGEYEKALTYYETYKNISSEIGDKRELKTALGNIGNIYFVLNRFDDALRSYQLSYNISEEIGDKRGCANAIGNMGNIHANLEHFTEALKNYQQLADLSREISYKTGYAFAMGSMGNIYYHQGYYIKALEIYEKALELYKEINDKMRFGYSTTNMGYVYFDRGEFQKALDCFIIHKNISKEIGDKRALAISYFNIANIFYSTKDHEEALGNIKKALKLFYDLNIPKNICRSLNLETDLLIKLHRYSDALESNNKVIKLAEESDFSQDLLQAKIYRYKLIYGKNPEKHIKELNNLENISEIPEINAQIFEELFIISEEDNYRQKAFFIYKELYEKNPKYEYKMKLKTQLSNN